jgi:hypothetical protein
MPRAVKSTTKTAKTSTVDQPRISIGTAWETRNESFFAGRLKPADGRYANQEELMRLLPAPSEGHHWALKLFVREVGTGQTVVDVILQQEEDYQPEA